MKLLETLRSGSVNGILALGLVAAAVFYLATFVVDKTQYAIKIRLGDPVVVHLDPGLRFKLPFVTRVYFVDNRLLNYDADPGSVFTKDKKEMVVDTYAKWRVAEPLKFYETVKNIEMAQARLDDIIYSQTREVLGQYTLVEIVSGNRKEIRKLITERSRENAKSFGIDVQDVRVKRADLPSSNSLAVFGRMEAERKRQAKLYRSEGEERALEIRSEADRERITLLAKARQESEKIRGHADADATKIYADAYNRDPEFFSFLRSQDVYRASLKEGTTLLLNAEQPLFRHMQQ